VYPALAVLQTLYPAKPITADQPEIGQPPGTPPEWNVLWVGGEGGMEADLVQRAGFPFETIPAAGVHGVGMRALPGNLLKLARGYSRSREILRRFQPDVLFFTGGFVAVPMALAGAGLPARMRPASMLYVPDIEPGLALKTLARFAGKIAVTAEESRPYFHRRAGVEISGYPVRPDLKSWDVETARRTLGLQADLPVLLVVGGSSGARSINRAVLAVLPELLAQMQVIHLSGRLDWAEVEARRSALEAQAETAALLERYRPFPYLHEEMGAALSAADLALARSGASTLGEFPFFGLPAVLVPYPYAWRYQQVNAEYLARRGAAVIVQDQDLQGQILRVVAELMSAGARREQMRQAMRAAAHRDAAQTIASLLMDLAEEHRDANPIGAASMGSANRAAGRSSVPPAKGRRQ
jgi:UDP-N-acetylglucosamine--N-acetylmuramyl-(pentapeptide) pyrophosphoryl-undecaprenol N-acetylglucosamine transferase